MNEIYQQNNTKTKIKLKNINQSCLEIIEMLKKKTIEINGIKYNKQNYN